MIRWLPVTVGAVGLLAVGDVIAMLLRQHRVQARRRTALLEQYLPLVEELIEQVRARQHDFNNQMMAVAAAVSAARDLQDAQEAVTSLLQNVRLDGADKELLKCDSKVISGLLFGKMKQAELKQVRVEVTIAGAFLRRVLSEADWVEVIAILLDNAIEAAAPGDVVYARAARGSGQSPVFCSESPRGSYPTWSLFRCSGGAGRRKGKPDMVTACIMSDVLWNVMEEGLLPATTG